MKPIRFILTPLILLIAAVFGFFALRLSSASGTVPAEPVALATATATPTRTLSPTATATPHGYAGANGNGDTDGDFYVHHRTHTNAG